MIDTPAHEEWYEQKCNLFVILSHCHNGIFANGFCRTREKANELVEKHGSRFNKHTVEGHILDQWFSGGVASRPTVGPSIENKKVVVRKKKIVVSEKGLMVPVDSSIDLQEEVTRTQRRVNAAPEQKEKQ